MNTADGPLVSAADDLHQNDGVSVSSRILLRHILPALIAAPVLTVTADLLLFETQPGINLVLLLLLAASAVMVSRIQARRPAMMPLAIIVVSAMLLVEAPSGPGGLLATFGLGLFALDMAGLLRAANDNPYVTSVRAALVAPVRVFEDLHLATHAGGRKLTMTLLFRTIAAGAVPLLLSTVFILLFAAANPLVDNWLHSALGNPFLVLHPARMVFWVTMFAAFWAIMRPRLKHRAAKRAVSVEPRTSLFFSPASMFAALVLFNVIFAIQSGLDITFLWGGAALPDGMTYAEYAHRGAYPLVATALLAALFVLVVMRRNGPGQQSRALRALVYVFIAQNIMLCAAAMYRLDLYIQQYLLTEFRLAAAAWMTLVMAGLVFIVIRIWLRKSNGWLWSINLTTLGFVVASFAAIDTSALVANYNVSQSRTQQSAPLDIAYLETLGPSAIPALDRVIINSGDWPAEVSSHARLSRTSLADDFLGRKRDWRSWNWRAHRIAAYLGTQPRPSF